MLGSVLRINSLCRILTIACSLGTIIYGTFLRLCLLSDYIILGLVLSIGFPIYFFFELGTDRLLNRSQLVNLDEVARIAKKYGLKVKVIGAADSATGSEAINDNLSRSRARFIAEELMKRGMENGTISQIFDGGIDDYSPNEANRHTRILLYL